MLIIFRMKNMKIGEYFSVNLCPNDAKRGHSSFISTVFDPEIVVFLIIGASHKKEDIGKIKKCALGDSNPLLRVKKSFHLSSCIKLPKFCHIPVY